MMGFPHVALAVPCWDGATYQNILRSLFAAGIVDGPDREKLRSAVIERFGVKGALLCGSGRMALEMALRACGVRPADEVIIPTFCCTSVISPVLALGAVPVLADIGDDLNMTPETIEPAITERTKALIVPHLFGNPADINAIVELARSRNVRVIDDAAQALGAVIESRSVGGFGDAGVLSFGREKVCSGIGGGLALFRESERLTGILKDDLPRPKVFFTAQSFLSTMVWGRWRRWTRPLERLSFGGTGHADESSGAYRRETMANLNAAVALSLLEKLEQNLAGRRSCVEAYRELLGAEKRLRLIPHRPGSACLAQIVRILPSRGGEDLAIHVIEALIAAGYEVQGSYVPIHLLPGHEQWAARRLRRAERIWGDLIELPCEPQVSLNHVERITAIVKRTLKLRACR
ncbi:MAG TPA: DegT/DnrJ/EryC1/StrS family aminotransferase [Terriglobales bacterium]|nr:DegT/DnrJ/EryC1/StrS family aminotransferase [Terriglobales bacterium]